MILYNSRERIKRKNMIENEINIGNKFKMRVNFNLIKKGWRGREKADMANHYY